MQEPGQVATYVLDIASREGGQVDDERCRGWILFDIVKAVRSMSGGKWSQGRYREDGPDGDVAS